MAEHAAPGHGNVWLTAAQRARRDIREGRHAGSTRGVAPGYVQANLVIVDRSEAYDFLLRTAVPTIPAGRFHGPLAVTMRWLRPAHALTAIRITARFPQLHGTPFHVGDPAALGVDVERPLFGPAVPPLPPGLVPVFWACGVTPQEAARAARLPLLIAHAPGHGFITDLELDQWAAR